MGTASGRVRLFSLRPDVPGSDNAYHSWFGIRKSLPLDEPNLLRSAGNPCVPTIQNPVGPGVILRKSLPR